MGQRGPAPKQRNLDWTGELAYAVGLIVTDGNLSSDGRHIDFTSKDLQLIQTFKNCLNLENKIGFKFGGFSKPTMAYRVQFGDVVLYRWLLSIGITPKKSKTIGSLQIPDEFFFDFLRGHLDGDGTISTFPDPVYPNAERLYVLFHSASLAHLEWLRSRIQILLGLAGFLQQGHREFVLKYAKQESMLLLRTMYYGSGFPCLERKQRVAERFLDDF